jgi:ADP-ribose pyrophosphatase YjhB (NUDIX family)
MTLVKGSFVQQVPEGDDRQRLVCADCGFVRYDNPKVVVGAVCLWQDKVLLCRRAIDPKRGAWTIPAGYLELNESTAEGARREVREEACAEIAIGGLVGIYDIPHISQVYIVYAAALTDGRFAAGRESLEVGLFAWADVPWDRLAFSAVGWALERYRDGAYPAAGVAPPRV